jgi:flagellar hook assembly protein FlgD
MYSSVANAGDYCQVAQRVSVGPPAGIGQSEDSVSFSINPNPSLNNTAITYQMPDRSDISMKIYDTNGRLVKVLVDDRQEPGLYLFDWDGSDVKGRKVANGVYFCKFIAEPVGGGEKYTETRKLVYLR